MFTLRVELPQAPVCHRPYAEQDAFDAHLLTLTQTGKGERGQLLARLIQRAGGAPAVTAAALAQEMDAGRQ